MDKAEVKKRVSSDEIISLLQALQDEKYAAFQRPLMPTVGPDTIIGVRTPDLRRLAKNILKTADISAFLTQLPHSYFEENQLHAFLLSGEKDFQTCVQNVEQFLPYIDNWATCDQLSSQCFAKHTAQLLPYIEKWLKSEHEYTVRFAIGMLMRYFLDDAFSSRYHKLVASIKREEYYIKMMQAWYFATALAKQYEATLPFLLNHKLEPWTHNKTIQKAVESYRITDEQKTYLRTLKVAVKK